MSLPTSRRIHRLIALASAIVLVSSAVTRLLWAYSPYLFLLRLQEDAHRGSGRASAPARRHGAIHVDQAAAAPGSPGVERSRGFRL